MISGTIKMRAKQFLRLGDDPPGVRLELAEGKIVVSPSPNPEHANVVQELGYVLMEHIKRNKLGKLFGDVDTILDEYSVRRPDLLFFAKERLGLVGKQAMEGPPDLAIEVVSPSSVTMDRRVKFNEYRRAGVAHYWIVDAARKSIESYSLSGRKYELSGKGTGVEEVTLPPFDDLVITLGVLWLT